MTDTKLKSSSGPIGIFLIFLRLGLVSFGGPVAHIGYFRREFVQRRQWLTEHGFADLVGLCQFLPGPTSSQVGMALGLSQGGLAGAVAAWLGFTLPSAVLLVLFGLGLSRFGLDPAGAWLHGFKVAAVAVVAQAILGMGRALAPDRPRASLMILAALAALLVPGTLGQIGVILAGGLLGWLFLKTSTVAPHVSSIYPVGKRTGAVALILFFAVLFLLPGFSTGSDSYSLRLFNGFYRAGAMVFGGGHVVLPLLQALVVPAGWVSNQSFLAGYGAAQAVPGPLFTFAAYLGAVSSQIPAGWTGAGIALIAIFLPGFLLILGVLPYWEDLRSKVGMRHAVFGVNAAVVGLLLAAFYNTIWIGAIQGGRDFGIAAAAFILLEIWNTPAWLVVALAALAASLGG